MKKDRHRLHELPIHWILTLGRISQPFGWTRRGPKSSCSEKSSTVLKSALALLLLLPAISDQTLRANEAIKVMSFNVRYGTADDGDNHWDRRKHLVIAAIREFAPDIVGTQEMMRFQADHIGSTLSEYRYYGTSREPDNENGEECGVFVRADRYDVLELRHFWLSETPEVPGSKSWDSSLPRMATWLRLRDKRGKQNLIVLNTHFDHRGKEARVESAKLIHRRLSEFDPKIPMIITGDFNTPEDSPPYQALTATDQGVAFRDSFRVVHPDRTENEGTFNGFRGRQRGARIDWILYSSSLEVVEAEIDTFNVDGQYPSDHFPVRAIFQPKSP